MGEFQPFVMEHSMGKWEVEVEYNLSESGVHPVALRSLLDDDPERINHLLDTELNYPQVNGTPGLRERIAALYEGADAENVLVTVGAAEANFIAASSLVGPGDNCVVMVPNYMQIWGVAKNCGAEVRTFSLKADEGWAVDTEQLRDNVDANTRFIAVCNPNNPTGRVMTEAEIEALISIADAVGAWIIADEVYAGSERTTDTATASLYGRYDKVIAIGSLSKAYGLPGLRVGWAVAPADMLENFWYRHDYAAITTTMLANQLGEVALAPEKRKQLLARTREYIRSGYPVFEAWLEKHSNFYSVTPPDAAAIAFVRYEAEADSLAVADAIRELQSVLIVPGDHFHVPQHLRISFGLPHDYLNTGLTRLHEAVIGFGSGT